MNVLSVWTIAVLILDASIQLEVFPANVRLVLQKDTIIVMTLMNVLQTTLTIAVMPTHHATIPLDLSCAFVMLDTLEMELCVKTSMNVHCLSTPAIQILPALTLMDLSSAHVRAHLTHRFVKRSQQPFSYEDH